MFWTRRIRRSVLRSFGRNYFRPWLERLEGREVPATVSWVSTVSGFWDVGSNWSTGAVPQAGDDVLINVPGANVTVTHRQVSAAIKSLQSTEALVLSGGTLTIGSAATDVGLIDAALTISGGTLAGAGTVTVGGMLTWTGGGMSGTGSTAASGGIVISGSGGKALTQRTLNSPGRTTWTGGDVAFNNGAVFNNQAGATFDAQTDRFLFWNLGTAPAFNNAGSFVKSAGTGQTPVTVPFNNSGDLDLQTGTLQFSSSFTQTAGSTLLNGGTLRSASPLTLQGGSLRGNGSVIANVLNSAIVAPGSSPGSLTITGNYTQTATGTLAIEIGGTTVATQYDRLTITGSATLAGTLAITRLNNFTPVHTDTFRVLTFTQRTGDFTTRTGLAISPTLNFVPRFDTTGLNLDANGAPSPTPDTAVTPEDQPITLNVLSNDTDPDNDPLTVTLAVAPAHGQAVVNANNTITYTPTPNYNGPDTFTYHLADGSGLLITALVTLDVTPVNDAPVLDNSGVPTLTAVAEDTTNPVGDLVSAFVGTTITDPDTPSAQGIAVVGLTGTANGTWRYSADGTTWTAFGTVSPQAARLLPASYFVQFVPNADFAGPVSFTYHAWDQTTGTAGATADLTASGATGGTTAFSVQHDTATLTVTEVNDAPVRTAGTVANLTMPDDNGIVSLGLTGLAYGPGGGSDEANQTLTCTVLTVPPSSLGDVLLPSGAVLVPGPVSLSDLRQAQFRPSATALGSATFSFRVSDNGTTNRSADPRGLTESLTITVQNVPPTITLTGNATVGEGVEYALTLGAVVDVGQETIQRYIIRWGDNQTTTVEAANLPANRTLRHVYADGSAAGTPRTISVDVVDEDGTHAGAGTKLVTVTNRTPTVAIAGVTSGVRGQLRNLTLTATDPSPADQTAGFTYRINWGDNTGIQVVTGSSPLGVSHVYAAVGTFTVSVTATDKDGGVSTASTTTMPIRAVELQAGTLAIGGTTGNDTIQFQPTDTLGNVRVTINGTLQGTFRPTVGIAVFAQAGNDSVQVVAGTGRISVPITVDAGDGNDSVNVALALGSATLRGGAGDDVLIGGTNSDGGAGSDSYQITYAGTGSRGFGVNDTGLVGTDVITITGTASADALVVTASQVTRGNEIVSYAGAETLTLNSVAGNDTIQVSATAVGVATTINAGDGNDAVIIDSNGATAGGTVDAVVSRMVVNGQAGTNTLALEDGSDTSADVVTVTPTQISGVVGDSFFGTGGELTYSGIGTVTLSLGTGADTIRLTPSATTRFVVAGNDPAATAVGDRLELNLAGVTNDQVVLTGPGAGQWTFPSRQSVLFTSIENLSPVRSISGQVFDDANGNRIKDEGEAGLANVVVFLDANNNGRRDATETSTTTDAQGNYQFAPLATGTFRVRVAAGENWRQATANPADVVLSVPTAVTGVTFGLMRIPLPTGWARSAGGGSATANDGGQSVAFGADGSVYVTGSVLFEGDPASNPGAANVFFAKYSASGAELWRYEIGGAGDDRGKGIAVDATGVYVVGHFVGGVDFDAGPGTAMLTSANGLSGPTYDGFLVKLTHDGEYVWAHRFGGSTGSWDMANAVAVDANNNVWLTGVYGGSMDADPGPQTTILTSRGGSDLFVIKLSSAGVFRWAGTMGGPQNDSVAALTLDALGGPHLTGYYSRQADFDPSPTGVFNLTAVGTGTFDSDVYVVKLDPLGGFVSAGSIGGVGFQAGTDLVVTASNEVILAGYYQGTVDFDAGPGVFNLTAVGGFDWFVTKFDATGAHQWTKTVGSFSDDRALGIAFDAAGNAVLAGFFNGIVDADAGIGTVRYTSAGDTDILVLAVDAQGSYVWSQRHGGTGEDRGRAVATSADGRQLALTGFFNGTVTIPFATGSTTLTSSGGKDVLTARFDLPYLAQPLTLEAAGGTGDGTIMPRSNATNGRTVWLYAGETRTLTFVVDVEAMYELSLRYSNDGGPDRIEVRIDGVPLGQFVSVDTRPIGGMQGDGWNVFLSSGPLGSTRLTRGQHVVTIEVLEADAHGVEIDVALLAPIL